MATSEHNAKRTLTPEEKARKVEIQREYMRRKIANETADEREARLAKSRAYGKACYDRNPEHARALGRAKGKRAYASDPTKVRDINAASRARGGDKWNATRRAKRADDPEYAAKTRAGVAKSRVKHLDARNSDCREWYAANKQYSNAQSKAWREANPDRHLATSKAWREANIERATATLKAWREANPHYTRNRYQSDAEFKLSCCLRSRLVSAISRQRGKKAAKTEELIGCGVAFLRQHIEAQFAPEMTWGNYGIYWHVDHIMPCATFDLADPAQQRECFHYTNLRPLTATDNLARPRHPRHYKRAA